MVYIIVTKIMTINKEGRRKLLELIDKFMTQTVVMVSEMYAYIQTHQVIYIKYVCQPYLNRLLFNKIKKTM